MLNDSSRSGEERRAIVIGGGIVGLTAAHALRSVGWNVVVCERSPAIRGGGASIGLWPNAISALETLELRERVSAHGSVEGAPPLRDPFGPSARHPPDERDREQVRLRVRDDLPRRAQ